MRTANISHPHVVALYGQPLFARIDEHKYAAKIKAEVMTVAEMVKRTAEVHRSLSELIFAIV